MFTHPDITAAVAADRRRDLLARAGTYRAVRAAAAAAAAATPRTA
jgi:hypothetical protein